MIITKLAIFAVGGIATLAAGSFALPRHVSVERSATMNAAPQEILALAASNSGFQDFNPYLTKDPNLKIDLFGPETGTGSGFHFDGKDGKGSQTIAQVSDNSVVYTIDLGPMGQPTQSITATPNGTGTDVVWRVDSDMGFNPIFRVFGLFMDGMMGPTFEIGLENLAKAAA